jgi:RNA polymerase sigma-70 factor (ECF subfamily)
MTRDNEKQKAQGMEAVAGVLAGKRAVPLSELAEAVGAQSQTAASLLEAARDGDADAFAGLVRQFQTPTYRFILRMVRRPAVAEDVAQEVFFRLWENLSHLGDADLLPAWLRRVATNAVIDHWRKEDARRRRRAALREHPIARHVVRPSARMESQEAVDAVRAAVDALPVKLRSVLMLRTVEGLSYDQLADTLGISVGAVRSRLFRARQELLAMLKRSRAADYLAAMYSGSDGDGDE